MNHKSTTVDSKASASRQVRGSTARTMASVRKAGRRNRWWLYGGAVAVLVALVVAVTVAVVDRQQQVSAANPPGGRQTNYPWGNAADVTAAVQQAGLSMLSGESTVDHTHVHLDIRIDGKFVSVAQFIGIDEKTNMASPLHTRNNTGIIYIDSRAKETFTLGQFFTEWNVALSANRIGGYAVGSGKEFHAYVNGKEVSGDPSAIALHTHDEIALVYGSPGQKVAVPKMFPWPAPL